jgi:uncharacterized protein (DUF885 family)
VREFCATRQFVASADATAGCTVAHSPPSMSWVPASVDCPGPYNGAAVGAVYFVTAPDAAWTADDREQWLQQFDRSMLHLMALHETWPGHYLQSLRWRETDSRARRVVKAPCFLEGWAHYCEEMCIDEGYGADDPRIELSQAIACILRCCRLLGFIRLHRDGDTIEEVARDFETFAYLSARAATAEAARVTFDLDCGDYTLGKILIKHLRDECREHWGPTFNLRTFHDRLLSLGVPPISVLQRHLRSESAL